MKSSTDGTDGEPSVAPAGLDLGLDSHQRRLFDDLETLMAFSTSVDRSTADVHELWSLINRRGDESSLISLINSSAEMLTEPQKEAVACLFPEQFNAGSGNLTRGKHPAPRRLGNPNHTARARREGRPNDVGRPLAALAVCLSKAKGSSSGDERLVSTSVTAKLRELNSSTLVGAGATVLVLVIVASLFLFNVESGNGSGPQAAANPAVTEAPVTSTGAAPATNTDPAAPRPGVATASALEQAQAGRVPTCNRPVGGPLVPAENNVWITQPMIEAYKAAAMGGFDLACPNSTAQSWGGAWYQEIDGVDPSQAGTIVAWGGPGSTSSDPADPTAVFLPRTMWLAYWNTGLDGGDSSQSLSGFPLDFQVDDEGHWISHMTLGDMLITEQPNVSGRWIPHQAMDVWEASGGIHGSLGLPMTNVEYVDGVITQTYEYGKAYAASDGQVVSEVYDQAVIDADVAALSRKTNGILSTYDSTDWWIDESGVRHWIPSGPDHDNGALFECLGGLDNTIAEGLDGWVIATFPLGDNAVCTNP